MNCVQHTDREMGCQFVVKKKTLEDAKKKPEHQEEEAKVEEGRSEKDGYLFCGRVCMCVTWSLLPGRSSTSSPSIIFFLIQP